MRAIGILAALLAILLWTFANTIVELENYRAANSAGMCHVAGTDYATDAPARIQRDQCLAGATTQTSPIRHLLHVRSLIAHGLIP